MTLTSGIVEAITIKTSLETRDSTTKKINIDSTHNIITKEMDVMSKERIMKLDNNMPIWGKKPFHNKTLEMTDVIVDIDDYRKIDRDFRDSI